MGSQSISLLGRIDLDWLYPCRPLGQQQNANEIAKVGGIYKGNKGMREKRTIFSTTNHLFSLFVSKLLEECSMFGFWSYTLQLRFFPILLVL